MRLLSIVKNFLRFVFRSQQIDAELDDEIHSTVELLADQKIKDGMRPDEARRAARIELGGVEQVKEEVRAVRVGAWFDTFVQDVRFGLRILRKNPGYVTVAVATPALSIGATAVVFTAIKSVLIHALPYAHPENLVQIRTEFVNARQSLFDWATWNDAQEIIKRTRTLESVGIYGNAVFNLTGDAKTPPEALYGLLVSASLFPTLGVRPMLGRNIHLKRISQAPPTK